MDAIVKWFALPAFEGNEEKRRQSGLVMMSVLGFLAFTVVMFFTNLMVRTLSAAPLLVNAVAVVSMVPVHRWLHQDRLGLAKRWLVAVMFVYVTVDIASLGTIRAPMAAIYLPGVIISGLLFDRRGVLYATTACSLAMLGLLLTENSVALSPPDFSLELAQWLTYTALCGFTGSLICAANQVTQNALARAERALAQRNLTEASLNIANQKLSLRVREVEALHEEMRKQAQHDGLTGLCNRRYLNDTIGREIARAKRHRSAISFIMMDIDHFKHINDTHGHPAGDEVLVQLAQLLTRYARGSDIACRHGGEEFLLVLNGTCQEVAQKHAEALRQQCEAMSFHAQGATFRVTLSFGIAAYPVHGIDWEDIIHKADQALYQSKHEGRNRVTVWQGDADS